MNFKEKLRVALFGLIGIFFGALFVTSISFLFKAFTVPNLFVSAFTGLVAFLCFRSVYKITQK